MEYWSSGVMIEKRHVGVGFSNTPTLQHSITP
jgi:hypothetical protein